LRKARSLSQAKFIEQQDYTATTLVELWAWERNVALLNIIRLAKDLGITKRLAEEID